MDEVMSIKQRFGKRYFKIITEHPVLSFELALLPRGKTPLTIDKLNLLISLTPSRFDVVSSFF